MKRRCVLYPIFLAALQLTCLGQSADITQGALGGGAGGAESFTPGPASGNSGAYLQRGPGPFQTIPPFGPDPTNPIFLSGTNDIGDVVRFSVGSFQSGAFVGLRIGPVQQY